MTNDALTDLTSKLRGTVFTATDEGYDEARRIWNGTVDKRPAVIVRCGGVADVIDAVNYAREQGLSVSIRGGGHHVAGSALNDDGLVIDLSQMRSVRVDPAAGTARAEGGAQIVDVDRECMPFNLCVPLGVFSETGIAGITLAGGVGWLRRKYGMTCDSLVSADVVTADGKLVKTSATENPELFWALRGGWDMGVVTSFEYQARPIEPEIAFLFVTYPIDEAAQVMRGVHEFMRSASDAFSPLLVLWTFPEDEAYPQEVWGKQFIAIVGPYAAHAEEGMRAIEPLRHLGTVLLDASETTTYYAVQHLFDHEYPKGRRYYWKSSYLTGLEEGAIEQLIEFGKNRPSALSSVDVWTLGGAISRIGADETPLSQRQAPYMIGIEANWDDPAADAANIAWTRELASALQPFSTGASYLNFEDLSETGAAKATHGANFERLVRIKKQYDPENLFRSRRGLVD
ncbi:MAG: FAD-binding oxidoreductase [Dehalococcoidia bacterium]